MLPCLLLQTALCVGQTANPDPPPSSTPIIRVLSEQPASPSPVPEKEREPIQVSAPLLPPAAATPAAAPAPPAAVAPPRWFLMKDLQGTWPGSLLDGERMQVTGWFQGSFTASTAGDDNNVNLPLSFDYKANQALLQQAWVRVARSVVTSGTSEPTYGFQSDWILGTDYRFTLPRGVFNQQLIDNHGMPNTYGADPVQFYGEAYYPTIGRGLDIKLGRFYCPCGVESLEAVSTPFLSHSYTFANAPPFTHTGILATQVLTPIWTVQLGVAAGNDVILGNTSDNPTLLATVQWTQPGGRNIVKFATVLENPDFDVGGAFQNYDIFDLVWTHTLNPALTYNMEAIYGFERNIPPQMAADGTSIEVDFANWAGWAHYLAYTISPRLTAQARFELFYDPQGIRTSSFTVTGGPATLTDAKGLYEALTLGLVWTPRITKAILIRPEIRYDHNDESRPFQGRHGLLTAASDLIIRW